MIGQAISLGGAAMILAAFAAQQGGRLRADGKAYLALNLAGSAILTYFAVEARNLGLIVLEASWALVSLLSLARGAGGGRKREETTTASSHGGSRPPEAGPQR
jgi:hypothetical protein